MASANPLTVFVSSTCFDLLQIRRDLEEFIEAAGYVPKLSDSPASFAVNPWEATIVDACKRAVRSSDIVFLIVGGRYGHTPDASTGSITNIEYQEAITFGVPVLTFVDKKVLLARNEYVRQGSPETFTHSAVDDIRIFSFLDEVQSAPYGNWMFPFEIAQEIVATGRAQLSYLFASLVSETRKTRLQKELAFWAAPAFGYINAAAFIQAAGQFAETQNQQSIHSINLCLNELSLLSKNAGIAQIEAPIFLAAVLGEKARILGDKNALSKLVDIDGIKEETQEMAVAFQIGHRVAEAFFKQNITGPLEIRYGTAFTEQIELGRHLGATCRSLIAITSGMAKNSNVADRPVAFLNQIRGEPLDVFDSTIQRSRLHKDAKQALIEATAAIRKLDLGAANTKELASIADSLKSGMAAAMSDMVSRYHEAQMRLFDRVFHTLSLPSFTE